MVLPSWLERGCFVLLGALLMTPWLPHMKEGLPTSGCTLRVNDRVEQQPSDGGIVASSSPDTSTRRAINFLRDPDIMVEAFRDCKKDNDCRFVFHHAFKTGGTTIESVFENMFHQQHQKTCCDDEILQVFKSQRKYFCHEKFTSWQVHSDEFWGVVQSCARMLLKDPVAGNRSRWVVLTTFREVIEMTVSHIHQRCNKNLDRRSPRIMDACRACNYSQYTDVWDDYVAEINRQVTSIYNVAHYLAPNATALPMDRIQVFTMEPNDIDDFFYQWNPKFQFPAKNPEDHSLCNFRVPSSMMKKLRPAQELYRQLVTGIDFT